MDISGPEAAIPMPISSSYAGCQGHGYGHRVHDTTSHNHVFQPTFPPLPSNGSLSPDPEDHIPYKKVVRYRECLKNHAAAMGGNATDGCGEFMPSGEEGTLEALKCSACNCHRNFHRKEIEGEPSSCECHCPNSKARKLVGRKGVLITNSEAFGYPTGGLMTRPQPPSHVIMSYNSIGLPSESDEQEGDAPMARPPLVKKRFRTKFTQEQKEKMQSFAEKFGWKIQKQEEGLVQQFCQEIGVKRRVLKVTPSKADAERKPWVTPIRLQPIWGSEH
ncbi:hypothetical protein MRB53_014929 [Persea americana]|uniref:Uncharacterized protein n=1 Tax=Persea americana TaxID=3435 RepID=A0ACC2KC68_PERAE|nr:hypothetical protein MRB53_014929 [Persea americana]